MLRSRLRLRLVSDVTRQKTGTDGRKVSLLYNFTNPLQMTPLTMAMWRMRRRRQRRYLLLLLTENAAVGVI